MKFTLLQLTAVALLTTGAYANVQPRTALRGSDDIALDSLDLALGSVCTDLGDSAAEHVVKDNWCKPDGSSYSSAQGSWPSNCRSAAISVCEGTIPDVADRWCPNKKMRTSDLLDLMDECEDQVDDMVGNNDREPNRCGQDGKCGSCKQEYCPDVTERKECKADLCGLEEIA